MRTLLKVNYDLQNLKCHDEGDGIGNAEPYLWTIFFKIDGTTCRLNNSLNLEGTATVFTNVGSHGNLGNTDVDEGDNVPIPAAIGQQEMTLSPIPVPQFVRDLGTHDLPAFTGCILVLMEEDNVSDHGAEAGHQALNTAVEAALNSLIPTLGVANQDITDEAIDAMVGAVQGAIESAIENSQNIFENLWSWLNKDDKIGTKVFKFSGDQLLDTNPMPLQVRWQNEGDWEITGEITTRDTHCTADLIKAIFESMFGAKSAKKSMDSMYRFRDHEMEKHQGLEVWWDLIQRNSNLLEKALKNTEVAEAAVNLFKHAPDYLENRDQVIGKEHYNAIDTILNHMLESCKNDRLARKDLKYAKGALSLLQEKTTQQFFDTLSKITPSRKPTCRD